MTGGEWLYEEGIGECRAALVRDGRLLEMRIELESSAARAGAIVRARLIARADASGRGRVALDGGEEASLSPVPPGSAEGAALIVEIVREAFVEPGGQRKTAIARLADTGRAPAPGPDLRSRLDASPFPVRQIDAARSDALESHGWSGGLEEAATGIVARPEALLRISLTPAMTLIDIDGSGSPLALATAGATLAGEAIRRFGIVGSIGIDLPTLPDRSARLAAAAALDATLPKPFERTAVNGFGFLQLVRRRTRASVPELLAADPALAAARALLRRGERARGYGALTLTAAAPVVAGLSARPEWIAALERRTGAPVRLASGPAPTISGGHAQYDHS